MVSEIDKAKAVKYCKAIKNKAKQIYAWAFYDYLLKGGIGQSPSYTKELSYMAAQAVRSELYSIIPEVDFS